MESGIGRLLFQKRNEKIDWRKLASVDVDRIAHEVDVDAIQDNILSVTYCNIEHELGYHSLDGNFIKLFRLAQLTIEYLLHCQEYLQHCGEEKENEINLLHQKAESSNAEHEQIKAELSKRNESYKTLKKELQKCRKLISDYQLMIRAGASGLHKCPCCNKSFVSEYYVRCHVERRHPEEAVKSHYPLPISHTYRNDTDLQNELNDIKTRLKTTENELKNEREYLSKIKMKDSEMRDTVIEEFKAEHEQWKFTEQEKMRIEMETYKEMIMDELRQTQKEKEALQKSLMQLEQSTGKKKSTLGVLVDDDESEETYFAKQKQEMEKSLKQMKDKYGKQIKEMMRQHSQELQQERIIREAMQSKMEENNRAHMEQIKELKEMLVEQHQSNKAGLDQVDYNKAKPPITPTMTPIQSFLPEAPVREAIATAPIRMKESLEKDSASFWVSSRTNGHQSFRVFREPASTKGDWKDLFSFNAFLEPSGEFNKPLYVYSCGGSPYWRQFVSNSDVPPKSYYKHEFTFYVSATKCIGTIKLRLVQAGSGEVIRSCITKDEMIPNWKDTGLVFYVLKNTIWGSGKRSVSRSATSSSDVFESISDDDDVSLSSFTGTDLVKQNLANEIKRSRENLVDESSNNKVNSNHQQQNADIYGEDDDDENKHVGKLYDMNDEEEPDDVSDDKNDDNENEANDGQSNFDGTSSGSLLNTTLLPERGEFYPFPGNPLARANYDHPKERLAQERENIMEFLEDNLEKHGVDLNETTMSNSIYKSKMKNHDKEVLMIEKQYNGFSNLRQGLQKAIDDHALSWFRKKKKSAGNKFKKTAQVIKAATTFQNREKRDLPRPVIRNVSKEEVVINHYDAHENNGDNEDEDVESFEDEDEDSFDEVDANLKSKPAAAVTKARVHSPYMGSSGNPPVSPVNFRDSQYVTEKQRSEEDDDEDEFAVSESSQWDSGGEEENEVEVPRVKISQSFDSEEEVYNPKMRSPKGEKVKKLAADLEASLTLRDPEKKKPAGAIDLHNVDQHDEGSRPKRTVSFQKENDIVEDFDDESDFSFTPRSDGLNEGNRVRVRQDDEFADNDDIDELLESYQTNKKPSGSSTPYTSKGGYSASNQTPVMALNVDDFDEDSF